jgi:hypothetical protein
MKQKKSTAFQRADDSTKTRTGATATGTLSSENVGNKEQCSDSSSTRSAVESEKGTPPSNTVPPNYTGNPDHTKILRYGIDSLYLSFSGSLDNKLEEKLVILKLAAQSTDDLEKASAQLKIGEHLFEVLGRGARRFPFVLNNNLFQIQLSHHSSESLPLAYVQISSEYLTFTPFKEVIKELCFIINSCGLVTGEPKVSRVDLFVDFTTQYEIKSWDDSVWVSRAEKTNAYGIKRQFSGWVVGEGGAISARLYNKTTEIKHSKKDYLKPLWKEKGWNSSDSVWRLEFQLMRGVLKELSTLTIDTLLEHQGGLWNYASKHWLRLTIPSTSDSNQTRWPTHPLWVSLQEIPFRNHEDITLKRVRLERLPSDDSIFINGFGGITSFMAREGITDLGEGIGEFFAQAERFHEHKGRKSGVGLKQYISTKVNAKGRKYNTIDNRIQSETTSALANSYRKAKNGE